MSTIILITALVLCDGQAKPMTRIVETTKAAFQHDVQLLRMGWVEYGIYDRRCKATKLRYETVSKNSVDNLVR